MDTVDKIKVLSAKINSIEIGLKWLAENNLTSSISNRSMSTEQQISDLKAQKNALQQEVERLNNI